MVAPPTLVPLVAPNLGDSLSGTQVTLKWQVSLTRCPPNLPCSQSGYTKIAVPSTPRFSKFGNSPRWQLPRPPDLSKPGESHPQHCCPPPGSNKPLPDILQFPPAHDYFPALSLRWRNPQRGGFFYPQAPTPGGIQSPGLLPSPVTQVETSIWSR